VTAAIVALGLFLRIRGYLFNASAFWMDECGWAMATLEEPLRELSIRPIGFMVVSRVLATVLAPTEAVLRAMPWIAGVISPLIAVPLARRLFETPAPRLLFVAIIAINPCAIDLSKEYKPYSVGLCLHLALLLLALVYLETRRAKTLGLLLGLAVVGGLFAQDLVFAYPGTFLVLGAAALGGRREHLWAVAGAAGFILLLLVGQYLYLWRHITASDTQTFTTKYNVFYSRGHGQSRFSWSLMQHFDMAALPGFRRTFWHSARLGFDGTAALQSIDRDVWGVLHVIGLVVLVLLRPGRRALLLVLPLGVLWLFNRFRIWPVGAFRTNLFVLGYVSAIACAALDVAAKKAPQLLDAAPALLLVIVPPVLLDRGWSSRKQAFTVESNFPQALTRLLQLKRDADPRRRAMLLVDRRSCEPYRYYTSFHPDMADLKKKLARHFKMVCVETDAELEPAILASIPTAPRAVWVVLHNDAGVRPWVRAHRQWEGAEMTAQVTGGSHAIVAFSRPKTSDTNVLTEADTSLPDVKP